MLQYSLKKQKQLSVLKSLRNTYLSTIKKFNASMCCENLELFTGPCDPFLICSQALHAEQIKYYYCLIYNNFFNINGFR